MTATHNRHAPAGRARLRAVIAALGSLALLVLPESAGAQPVNPLTPTTVADDAAHTPAKPFAAMSESALSVRDSIVALARAQIGTKYRFGGQTPDRGFDCSGLVRYVLGALRIPLPRTAAQQAAVGSAIAKDTTRLRPGDLLTFGRGGRVTHIGIYVGDGRYVHASTTAGKVIVTSLSRTRSPLVRSWRGAVRLLSDATTADSASCDPISGCSVVPSP